MKKILFILSLLQPIYAADDVSFTLTLSSLTHAGRISYAFFGSLFYYLYKLCMFVLSPFIYILEFLFRRLVVKPYELAAHVAHLLYPVTMFCLAAVFCGAVIGGFAGFAAEACSSLIITATWGPEAEHKKKKLKPVMIKEVIDQAEADADEEEEEEYDLFNNDHWEVPRTTSKGKEPMRPRMEQWRDSFSSSASSSPGLIRRMKMSSTSNNERKSSWEWEDDDYIAPTITKKPLI